MAFLQISVGVSGDKVEAVSETLNSIGALSVTVLDAGDEPLLEPAPGETPLWRKTRIVALFDPETDTEHVKAALCNAMSVPSINLSVESLEDRDWSNTWRDSFHSMCFGDHLWVCPVGAAPPDPDAVVISMDPGLAFGTGTHTTTALCLEWLDAYPPRGKRVIDYGCGSGILAIAAHRLGSAAVQAVDIDPQALTAARANAVRNGITGNFDVLLPEALPAGPVDLVLANILANPLVDLADQLGGRVCAGGRIVLTGILDEQAGEVMQAYQPRFVFSEPVRRDGWVRLDGTCR